MCSTRVCVSKYKSMLFGRSDLLVKGPMLGEAELSLQYNSISLASLYCSQRWYLDGKECPEVQEHCFHKLLSGVKDAIWRGRSALQYNSLLQKAVCCPCEGATWAPLAFPQFGPPQGRGWAIHVDKE